MSRKKKDPLDDLFIIECDYCGKKVGEGLKYTKWNDGTEQEWDENKVRRSFCSTKCHLAYFKKPSYRRRKALG